MRPLRVDYALTEAGAALLDPIRAMGARAARYADVVVAPQQRRAPDPPAATAQADLGRERS